MKTALTCIIIDDERKCRLSLRALIETYCPEVEIIAEAKDRASMLEVLEKHQPDLVFTDIEIGPLSAFDILNELTTIDFKIVFVTAYDAYAIQGYKYDAIDYLLKPVDSKALKAIVKKMVDLKIQLQKTDTQEKFKGVHTKVSEASKISISDHKKMRFIKTNDILYCIGQGNYTSFILNNNSKIVSSKSLKYNEERLIPYNFIRIHKSFLINFSHIDYIDKEQGGSVVMSDGKSLPISKNYKKLLYHKIAQI